MASHEEVDLNTVLAGALSNLISDAVKFVVGRATMSLSRRKGKSPVRAFEHTALAAKDITGEISLVALMTSCDGKITAKALSDALSSPAVSTSARNIFAANLVPNNVQYVSQALSSFHESLVRVLTAAPYALTNDRALKVAAAAGDIVAAACVSRAEEYLSAGRNESAAITSAMGEVALALLLRIQDLLKSINGAPGPQLVFDWKHQFRAQAVAKHGKIPIPDFREKRHVSLTDLYIPGRLSAYPPGDTDVRRLEDYTVYTLGDMFDRDVILGDPGGGKTTATNAIALSLASNDNGPVPIVVELRDFSKVSATQSLTDYISTVIRTKYQTELPNGILLMLLNTGDAAIVFDGLDELLNAHERSNIADNIELFANLYPNVRILVTSRKVGYAEAKLDPRTFRAHLLAPYLISDVEQYVDKWFHLQAETTSAEATVLVAGFIAESAQIDDLRTNPLLLALLCIIYRGQSYLPSNALDVYEQCSELLFRTWDKSRRIKYNASFEPFLDNALNHLAYSMFTTPSVNDGVPEHRLKAELADYFAVEAFADRANAIRAADEFVDFCKGRAWVLSEVGLSVDDEPLFKFTHRTFMEYFAAVELSRLYSDSAKLGRTLLPKVARNEWDVVARLAIHVRNRSNKQGAELAIKAMLQGSKSRSWGYRENVLNFLARTVDYLPTSPRIVAELTTACLDSVRSLADGAGSLPHLSIHTLIYVNERFDGVIDDAVAIRLRAWGESEGDLDQFAAFSVIANMQYNSLDHSVRAFYKATCREVLESMYQKGVESREVKWLLIYHMWLHLDVDAEVTAERLASVGSGVFDWLLCAFPKRPQMYDGGQPVSFMMERASLELWQKPNPAESDGVSFEALFTGLVSRLTGENKAFTLELSDSTRHGLMTPYGARVKDIDLELTRSAGVLGFLLVVTEYLSRTLIEEDLQVMGEDICESLIREWKHRAKMHSSALIDVLLPMSPANVQEYLQVGK